MRTFCPLRRSASLKHHSELRAPSVTGAASSKVARAGIEAILPLSRTQMNSACVPNPIPVFPKTRSPTANSEAAKERDRGSGLRVGFSGMDVEPVDRGGMHLDQDLVLFGDRLLHVLDPQDVCRAIVVVNDCSHVS